MIIIGLLLLFFNLDWEQLKHMYGGNKRLIKDSISQLLSWEGMMEMEKKNLVQSTQQYFSVIL